MAEEKYTDSEKYQEEIAEQYKQRIPAFSHVQVISILKTLGFNVADEQSIEEAAVGNVNATYLTPRLAIKINQDKSGRNYWANKVAYEMLPKTAPIAKVLAYDFFEKTDYEVLVMKRARGTLLLHDVFDLTEDEQIVLFKQVIEVVKQLSGITFQRFGLVNAFNHFPAYGDFLADGFKRHIAIIRSEKLCAEEDIQKVEEYFLSHFGVFADDMLPVFVHTDLHMGNILHAGSRVTAILDADSALQAPKWVGLRSLLGVIADPSQYVEGTPDFLRYKGKNFYHFLPMLREELADAFADPGLIRKLNVRGVAEQMKWIAENWSAEWNKETMRNVIERELAANEGTLRDSYYGKVLAHMER